jgi:hypothetical protein
MNPNSASFNPASVLIWMGYNRNKSKVIPNKFYEDMGGRPGGVPRTSVTDKTLTYAQVLQNFDKLKPNEVRQMAAYLALAGYLQTGADQTYDDIDTTALTASMGDVRAAYENLVQDTLSRQQQLQQRITPTKLLERSIAYRLAATGIKWDGNFDSLNGILNFKSLGGKGAADAGPKNGDTKTISQTSRTVNLINPQDAKGMTRAMLQQQLGRDPSTAEYEDFLSMLHAAEYENPSTSTTTAHMVYDKQGGGWRTTSDSTTTHQGIGAEGEQQLAYEKATQNPDWAEWQAMGTYAPALYAALGATVSGV